MTGPNGGSDRIAAAPGEALAETLIGIVRAAAGSAQAEPARFDRSDAREVGYCIHDCITYLYENGREAEGERLRPIRLRFLAHFQMDDDCGNAVCSCRD